VLGPVGQGAYGVGQGGTVDPVFGHSSTEVVEWLQWLSDNDREIITVLRGIIAGVAPGAHEIIYHGALGYGPTDSGFDRILYISVFNDHINLGLFYGPRCLTLAPCSRAAASRCRM
jgi:hypothetical protein